MHTWGSIMGWKNERNSGYNLLNLIGLWALYCMSLCGLCIFYTLWYCENPTLMMNDDGYFAFQNMLFIVNWHLSKYFTGLKCNGRNRSIYKISINESNFYCRRIWISLVMTVILQISGCWRYTSQLRSSQKILILR